MFPVWLEILLTALGVGLTLFGGYITILLKVRKEAEGAINAAEELDLLGAMKMEAAIETVYTTLPKAIRPFIQKEFIKMILQGVFD